MLELQHHCCGERRTQGRELVGERRTEGEGVGERIREGEKLRGKRKIRNKTQPKPDQLLESANGPKNKRHRFLIFFQTIANANGTSVKGLTIPDAKLIASKKITLAIVSHLLEGKYFGARQPNKPHLPMYLFPIGKSKYFLHVLPTGGYLRRQKPTFA